MQIDFISLVTFSYTTQQKIFYVEVGMFSG